ncbi:MAG: endonuclease/exonuclease/phosphatase family protein [Desulfuromonadaceae bacterium]|nr:endonuclease/exonuclease/phosphatase family protein [Desulfuromonadaceae bacterium]
MRMFCSICCWFSLALIITLWGLLTFAGDLWWPATFFLFAPRWLLALPVAVLIPFATWINRRLLLPLIAALLIVLGPIMGFTFSASKQAMPAIKPLRVFSCNLQNGHFNHDAFNALILDTQPDIVALQELPANIAIKSLEGWQHVFEGDLHIFSRYPLVAGDFRKAMVPLHKWPRSCFLYCTVTTASGNITFCTVHLPSPRYGLQNLLDKSTVISLKRKKLLIDETVYRQQKSQEIAAIVETLPSPKIIAGDFNMPLESTIYRNFWGKFQNAFSIRGIGYGWTERASVRGIPVGIRIDHVLMDKSMKPLMCATGPDVGSDHLPIIADVAF